MTFQFIALDKQQFYSLYGKSDTELQTLGVLTSTADTKPGYPCRVSLRDAEPGERLFLLNFEHQPANSPYRSSHAIFVIDGAETSIVCSDQVPEFIHCRQLSIRGFDQQDMIVSAELVDGTLAQDCIKRFFTLDNIAYLQVHTAKYGCFLANVVRA